MNEMTVQFHRHDLDVSFESNGLSIPFDVNHLCTVDNKMLLQQQQSNGALLQSINSRVAQIHDYLKNCEDEIGVVTMHFAESFTRLVFDNDTELIINKIKQQLSEALANFGSSEAIKVWVHPSCNEAIAEYFIDDGSENVEVLSDPLLAISDCRVEGPDSGWIARLENQLEICRQSFFEKMDPEQ